MFADYEVPSNENLTGNGGGNRFLIIKDEFRDRLWQGMKGNGEALVDVLPYQIEQPCGVSVDIEPKAKAKDKKFDNNGCYINKQPGDWAFQLNYWTHSDIGPGKKTFVCPRTFGEPCPVCEKEQQLLSSWPYEKGSEASSKYYKEVVAPLKRKNRTLFNILVEEQGEGKVYIWDTSWFFVPKSILGINTDPRTKEPIFWFDPDEGKSIFFQFANFDKSETRPEVNGVQFIKRDTPLSDAVLEKAVALEKCLIHTTYDEIVEIMNTSSFVEEEDMEEIEERKTSASEQLDEVFGKRNSSTDADEVDDAEDVPPFDVDEEPSKEEKPDSSRRTRSRNPEVANVKAINSEEELDSYCDEKEIELYPQDFDSFDDFKAAVIEWVSNN
jgi:hypothetical protein